MSEREVSALINEWLAERGWKCIRTPATRVRGRGGYYWIFEQGHPDYLCVRPTGTVGTVSMFSREDKSPKARTDAQLSAKQHAWAEHHALQGYAAYICPDGCDDPFAHFCAWYMGVFE